MGLMSEGRVNVRYTEVKLNVKQIVERGRQPLCYVLGHNWEATERRITRRRVVCNRCGDAEWQYS